VGVTADLCVAVWPAIVYPDLGEKDKAFFWLEKAYQGREHDLVFSRMWRCSTACVPIRATRI
jgi:hypothetical protein